MREWQSQSHVKWYCKYHVVFTPKYRKRAIFGSIRKGIGKILRELCEQEKVELVEGHALSDHVHLCLSLPPKYSVANTIGFLKGKSAIRIHREYLGKKRNFTGFHFWESSGVGEESLSNRSLKQTVGATVCLTAKGGYTRLKQPPAA